MFDIFLSIKDVYLLITDNRVLINSLSVSLCLTLAQALRCLRGKKRVEGKADRLYTQLETVKGILDRIASSQTDRLVKYTFLLIYIEIV